MRRRTLIGTIAAAASTLAARASGLGQAAPDATTAAREATTLTETGTPTTGYAPANGLDMYYEVHGEASAEHPPLILLHGAYGTASMCTPFILGLAPKRQVIVPEMEAHGHTGDIDRPIRYETMADDVAALLDHPGFAQADVFGYSMGGGIGLRLAMQHPDRVRKLVSASASSTSDGMYPDVLAMIETITPEMMMGGSSYAAYLQIAPDPEGFPNLVEKLKDLDAQPFAWPDDEVRAISAPTLLIFGDSDIVIPEHTIDLFRLRGGGVAGDLVGLPGAQLAVIPGATHIGVIERAGWFLPMIEAFLTADLSIRSVGTSARTALAPGSQHSPGIRQLAQHPAETPLMTDTSSTGRAERTAADLESLNARIAAVEGRTDEQWRRPTAAEGWSGGVVARPPPRSSGSSAAPWRPSAAAPRRPPGRRRSSRRTTPATRTPRPGSARTSPSPSSRRSAPTPCGRCAASTTPGSTRLWSRSAAGNCRPRRRPGSAWSAASRSISPASRPR